MKTTQRNASLAGFVLGLAVPGVALAQQDARVMPEPKVAPQSDRTDDGPTVQYGELVTDYYGWVETMEESMARAALEEQQPFVNDKARNGRPGVWEVIRQRDSQHPHSGLHYVQNKWGDLRMGIAFPGTVDVDGAWFVGLDQGIADARGLQVVGYRDGQVVATTDWFRQLGLEPSWFAMDLRGVDRVEIVAEAGYGETGMYGMDDLVFTDGAGRQHTITFDDLEYRDQVSGSGYAGLLWEVGTGFTTDADILPPPQQDGVFGPGSSGTGAGGNTVGTASGNGTLPILLENFAGPRMFDPGANFVPPDVCGAIGPNHFLALANSNISAYNKTAPHTRVLNQSLTSFLSTGTAGDPRVLFDHDSQRWIVLADDFNTRIYFAVSKTDDPTGAWFKGFITVTQGSDSGKFPDYPTLGVDARGIYWGIAMFGSSVTMTIFALDKAPLIAANPSIGTVTAFRSLPFEGAIQPANHYTDGGGAFCVSTNGTSRLRIRRVDPPLTAPTLTQVGFVNLSTSWSGPPNAPVLGGQPLDTLDGRLINSVYRSGRLWTTHTVGVASRAACRYYEVDPVALTEIQLGTVRDNQTQTLYFFNPSVDVNAAGNAVLGGTVSSSTQWAGAFYTGRIASDPSGEMAFPFEYKPGEGNYTQGGGSGYQRWGDYSLTTVDPTDGTIWTVQEYAATSNRWQLGIAHLDFPAGGGCTTSKFCNPASGSINNFATIDTSGCLLSGGVTISMANAPANQFTYLLIGDGTTVISQPPGSVGDLCVAGGTCLGRYAKDIGQVDGAGNYSLDISNTLSGGPNFGIPVCGGNIQSGQSWNFQFWHRNPMGAPSSFSEAISITFQ